MNILKNCAKVQKKNHTCKFLNEKKKFLYIFLLACPPRGGARGHEWEPHGNGVAMGWIGWAALAWVGWVVGGYVGRRWRGLGGLWAVVLGGVGVGWVGYGRLCCGLYFIVVLVSFLCRFCVVCVSCVCHLAII